MANSIRTQMVHHTRGGATTPSPAQRDADTVLQNLIYTYPRVFLRTRQLRPGRKVFAGEEWSQRLGIPTYPVRLVREAGS
jgi:hypothetical protein